ncbi:carboxy terminal-processing peptidase [Wohlfahrtiimonas larvae]|uniref:Carboxy terminal-processing peptidase n=1 Tax=Wohlfahrtiimonas larvae TaxID=1157986 RepID=A0ABP9MGE2_9GAMM|nr:carboxy terminal-processing peptidase [Wohlfahrtiimonas larvae]
MTIKQKKLGVIASVVAILLFGHVNASEIQSIPAATQEKQLPKITPNQRFERISSANAVALSQFHYGKIPLDEVLSERVYSLYLNSLDPQRVYFLQSDIEQFDQHKLLFSDYLRKAELRFPFEMYNTLIQRLDDRQTSVNQLIDRDFDFTKKEEILINRKDEPYAKTVQELDEIWYQRIKNELINLLVSDEELTLDEARAKLKKRYASRHERLMQVDVDDIFEIYMNTVALAFDPHSGYLSHRTMENFNINMSLSLQGIGTVLRQDDDGISIMEVVPGGPADQTNQLVIGDQLIGVAQGDDGEFLDIVGMRLDRVVDKIRGKKGTVVRLQIMGNKGKGPEKVVRIVRDQVKLEQQAAKSDVKTVEKDGQVQKIGVITLPAFYSDFEGSKGGEKEFRSTTRDIKKLVNELQKKDKIDGLIIDLRGNGGGALEEVINLSALFIEPKKTVVQVKNYNGSIDTRHSTQETKIYNGPLMVITDRLSASASEIFAGSIQDQARGLIVGNTTFGKGTVQSLLPLDGWLAKSDKPGQSKVTIAMFYRANGESTQEKGVVPDIVLPQIYNPADIGESKEKYVLPWDQIPASKDLVVNTSLEKYAKPLQEAHNIRLENDEKLKIFQKQRDKIQALWDVKTLSLNLDDRRKELKEQEDDSFKSSNEIRAMYNLEPLTLEQYKNEDGTHTKLLKDTTPDILLDESVNIMSDYIELLKQPKAK